MTVAGGAPERTETGRTARQDRAATLPRRAAAGPGGGIRSWGRPAALLVIGGAVLWAALSVVGYLITRTATGGAVVRVDTRLSRWFAARRTPRLDEVTHLGTMLSDTVTALGVTVLVVGALLVLRRFLPALTVVVAILGELFVFVLVTATLRRSRPPVPHLDPAPPTSSFPSGHTAAAVALYVCLAVLLLRSAVHRAVAVPVAGVLCLIWVIVGVSRLYRGMHYLSDVAFGAVGGGCWLLVTLYVLLGPPTRAIRERHRRA